MKIVVIIPTYNEADSVGEVIFLLEEEFKKMSGHEFQILVVDANSPDKTSEKVQEKAKIYGNIELLTEPKKRGLGSAYILGMNHAISKLKAEALVEFDGDFQHDPADLRRLIKELEAGCDYVIGSRYVPGGEIPEGWSRRQKFLSKYGSLFIRWMLALPTRDNTSGFKLSRVKNFAERLPLEENKILSRYHAYKIHLLYEMLKLGAKVKEVPIKFRERQGGSSKSTLLDIFESLKVVFILKMRNILK